MAGGWAERAADLGWDTLALLGCHPTRPLDHLNGAGLLWRISGGRISSMENSCCQSATRTVRLGGHVQTAPKPLLQQEKAHSLLLSVRHSHDPFGIAAGLVE